MQRARESAPIITDIEEAEAHQLVKTHRCGEPGCNGRLSVAWGGMWGLDQFVLRCGKDPGHKAIRPYFGDQGEIDMVSRTSILPVKYETPMGEVEISVEAIRQYLSPKATVEEAFIFLQKCRYQRLNPFMGEAYLVVFEETQTSPRTAQMMIGNRAHLRRAERHPEYQGLEAGIIVQRGGAIEQLEGALMAPGDQLLGGWCKVHRKGKTPFFISLGLREYDKGTRWWKQMPATMIRKCAVTQALDGAFPGEMAGLQGGQEFELAEENPVIVEAQLISSAPNSGPGNQDPARLERDLEDLYPTETMPQVSSTGAEDTFDPEREPPSALPESISSVTLLEQLLKQHGWDMNRFEIQVLGTSIGSYVQDRALGQAYQLFKKHVVQAAEEDKR